jgi:hypothetical protein
MLHRRALIAHHRCQGCAIGHLVRTHNKHLSTMQQRLNRGFIDLVVVAVRIVLPQQSAYALGLQLVPCIGPTNHPKLCTAIKPNVCMM